MIVSRTAVQSRLAAVTGDPSVTADLLGDVAVPVDLAGWLGRLATLYCVPYRYLVPDESMLVPESIRFFRLDINWVQALVDGAFSIGRNLSTSGATTLRATIDTAVHAGFHQAALDAAGNARATALGVDAQTTGLPVISGFILRSWVVPAYPGLGVDAYAVPRVLDQPPPPTLPILRFERLSPVADTVICLVEGDVAQFDVHEPPEHLHFGIDRYAVDATTGAVTASKNLAAFAATDPVTISGEPHTVTLDDCFRPSSPRVLRGQELATATQAANSAQMGYVMTEGVGMVSFLRGMP